MKTITRSNVYLPMAAMILTAALAVPAAAQQQVPFKGTMQGNDTDTGLHQHHGNGHYSGHGNWHPCRSILIHPNSYGRLHDRSLNRVGSLDRGQWRQHRYDSCRIG